MPRLEGNLRDWILARYPTIEADGLDQLFAAGDIVDEHARPWSADTRASAIRRGVWMWSGPLFRTILFECLWLLLFGRVLGWALVA